MPLRPELFRRLCTAFDDHVAIANENEEAVLRVTLDGITGKPMTKIEQPGEYLRVNCCFCNDTRQRLWINHRWGLYDPQTSSKNLHLAHCFNEDCLAIPGNVHKLYDLVFSGAGSARKDVLLRGKRVVGPSAKPVFPGEVRLVTDLPDNHPAALFLTDRGYDLKQLADHFRVSYCLAASSEFPLAQGRIIIPVYRDGQLVGWQARVVGVPSDPKIPKYYTMPAFKKTQHIYNHDRARHYPFVIICEGVTDVWRAGPAAVALFGKTLSQQQKLLIASTWAQGTAIVMLDSDALEDAREVYDSLAGLVRARVLVRLPEGKDPGDLTHAEIAQLVEQAAEEQGVELAAAA